MKKSKKIAMKKPKNISKKMISLSDFIESKKYIEKCIYMEKWVQPKLKLKPRQRIIWRISEKELSLTKPSDLQYANKKTRQNLQNFYVKTLIQDLFAFKSDLIWSNQNG